MRRLECDRIELEADGADGIDRRRLGGGMAVV